MIIIATLVIYFIAASDGLYSEYLKTSLQGCSLLGYPSASINECGYCVGNTTGLPSNYGKDCLGICHGGAIFDCNNNCDGQAYIDQCTHTCTDPYSSSSSSSRDCRGECLTTSPVYIINECNVCSLATTVCDNSCPLGNNCECKKDNCGHCCDENYCHCGNATLCENSDECYKIRSVTPYLVPKGRQTKISLVGYFSPTNSGIWCLLKGNLTDNIIVSPLKLNPNNVSSATCLIHPEEEDEYYIGLRLETLYQDIFENEPKKISVYESSRARITSMSPTESTSFHSSITLTFNGPNLYLIPNATLDCIIVFTSSFIRYTIRVKGNEPYTCIIPKVLTKDMYIGWKRIDTHEKDDNNDENASDENNDEDDISELKTRKNKYINYNNKYENMIKGKHKDNSISDDFESNVDGIDGNEESDGFHGPVDDNLTDDNENSDDKTNDDDENFALSNKTDINLNKQSKDRENDLKSEAFKSLPDSLFDDRNNYSDNIKLKSNPSTSKPSSFDPLPDIDLNLDPSNIVPFGLDSISSPIIAYSPLLPLTLENSSPLTIIPVLNNENLSPPFTFTLISSSPEISHSHCFISSNGLALVIMFNKPVITMQNGYYNDYNQNNDDDIYLNSNRIKKIKNKYLKYKRTNNNSESKNNIYNNNNNNNNNSESNNNINNNNNNNHHHHNNNYNYNNHNNDKYDKYDKNVCNIFTEDTINKLNNYSPYKCVWATELQLVVYLSKPINEDTIEIAIKEGTIKSKSSISLYNQFVNLKLRKLTTEWWSFEPTLLISGPSEISSCGIFTLSGIYSSPLGSSSVSYRWSIIKYYKLDENNYSSSFKSDRNNIYNSSNANKSNNKKNTLKLETIELIESNTSQNLILDGKMFNKGVYHFKLEAILRDEVILTATHRLIVLPYYAPIVSIYSNVMLTAIPYSTDQKAILWSEINIPPCVSVMQKVGIFWKVIDPHVQFNYTLTHSPVYIIADHSIPPSHPVTFYLNAYLGHRINETSGSAFSIIAKPAPLKAIINDGAPMISLGRNSGQLILSATKSSFGLQKRLRYHWNCIDSDTHEPCYKNNEQSMMLKQFNKSSSLLINTSNQNLPVLQFNSSSLPLGELLFSLTVSDLFNKSAHTLLLVSVIEGSSPWIYMGPITVNGIVAPLGSLGMIMVPAYRDIIITARVSGTVHWSTGQVISKKLNNEVFTKVKLDGSTMHPYGIHVVKLTSCNNDGQCSTASTQFTVTQGVTQCILDIHDYHVYEWVPFSIISCNIPPSYAPLTYQLYVTSPNVYTSSSTLRIPLSSPQYSPLILLPGIPLLFPDGNIFHVKICDIYGYCWFISSSTKTKILGKKKRNSLVNNKTDTNNTKDDIDDHETILSIIRKNLNERYKRSLNNNLSLQFNHSSHYPSTSQSILSLALSYSRSSDYFASLTLLNILLTSVSLKKLNPLGDKILENGLNTILLFLQSPSSRLDAGKTNLIYHILLSFATYSSYHHHHNQSNAFIEKTSDAIYRVTEKTLSNKVLPEISSLINIIENIVKLSDQLHGSTISTNNKFTNIVKNDDNDKDKRSYKVLRSLRRTYRILIQILATKLPLGKSIYLNYNNNGFTEIIHTIYPLKYYNAYGYNLSIGDNIINRYMPPWKCNLRICRSIIYCITYFLNGGLYPDNRISPVIEVNLFSPKGSVQRIRGLLNAITISPTEDNSNNDKNNNENSPLSETLLPKNDIVCLTWDESKEWVNDDVALIDNSCVAGKLVPIVIKKLNRNYNPGWIAISLISGLMIIIIIGYIVIGCNKSERLVNRR